MLRSDYWLDPPLMELYPRFSGVQSGGRGAAAPQLAILGGCKNEKGAPNFESEWEKRIRKYIVTVLPRKDVFTSL